MKFAILFGGNSYEHEISIVSAVVLKKVINQNLEFISEVIAFYEMLDRDILYDNKNFENMYMTSFLQALIEKYNNAKAVEIDGNWCEIDFMSDLEVQIEK